ncbi:glycolate oxidase subunit GlcE [Variovorax sp. VNK109]|uniref:glycolate oxidase subunit GlcE n=1 Tax=Variovorax sp. VNK109 TaxID=3400919 RepID=UPI003C12AE67
MDPALRQITDRIAAAASSGMPLRLRGGGSKDFYGGSPANEPAGEVLDTRPLSGITSYEPSELVVTARAGTPLAELEALLATRGQCLPFEPPSFGGAATVGGMVAAGLSGPARASSGAVRDFVLGVTLVNGRAEVLSFGGQVMKNVAGYDVSRLMVGSLGTLALIAEVSLKVLPVPPAECTLRFAMDEAQAITQLNRWAGRPLPLNASCWQGGMLWLRLRGAQAAVASARQVLGGERVDDAQTPWQSLREQSHDFFRIGGDECLWRMSVPDTAPPLGMGDTLLEWGGAQRWLRRPATGLAEVRQAATRAGGHATLFRAASGAPRHAVFTPLAEPLARIHTALKQQFDPHGIFGRDRLYAGF